MAYTIKGLARTNECKSFDCFGLAEVWNYWLACNCNDMQSVNDFKRLRKADRKEMLNFLRSDSFYCELYTHICRHICD